MEGDLAFEFLSPMWNSIVKSVRSCEVVTSYFRETAIGELRFKHDLRLIKRVARRCLEKMQIRTIKSSITHPTTVTRTFMVYAEDIWNKNIWRIISTLFYRINLQPRDRLSVPEIYEIMQSTSLYVSIAYHLDVKMPSIVRHTRQIFFSKFHSQR